MRETADVRPRALPAVGALALSLCLACGDASNERPNVLLVSIDTLRADHLGCYGYGRSTSPHLDALAAAGVRFDHAISQAPWTLPSMASLHTGLYPSQHGAFGMETALDAGALTLAEALRAEGYATSAVVTHRFVSSRYGFDQGFDAFDEGHVLGHKAVSSADVTDSAIAELRRLADGAFFLWVHYFDPHFSYVRHPEHPFSDGYDGTLEDPITVAALTARATFEPRDVAFVRDVYDEEIAYTDREIGRLVGSLDELGIAQRTTVYVTADHGEAFFERGKFGHGTDLYAELVRVPLLVGGRVPKALAGTVVETPVEVASLPATILAQAGLVDVPFPGVDLLSGALDAGRPSFSEGSFARGDGQLKAAVVRGRWKLIRDLRDGSEELFDVESDPRETNDLSAEPPEAAQGVLAGLREALDELARRSDGEGRRLELDDAEVEHLRSLGYGE